MLLDSTILMGIPDWVDVIKNCIEGLAILVGGGWALYRFGLFRERFPSMEIENNMSIVGENENEYLIELSCIIENKGKVRKWLLPLDFYFSWYLRGEDFIKSPKMNNEVWFQNRINDRPYWISPTWFIPFVDGGSKKQFCYLTSIPKDCISAYLYTRFFDFNSKKKAIEFILKGKDKKKYDYERRWEEQIKENLKYKNDIYISRKYFSIDLLKKPNIINKDENP